MLRRMENRKFFYSKFGEGWPPLGSECVLLVRKNIHMHNNCIIKQDITQLRKLVQQSVANRMVSQAHALCSSTVVVPNFDGNCWDFIQFFYNNLCSDSSCKVHKDLNTYAFSSGDLKTNHESKLALMVLLGFASTVSAADHYKKKFNPYIKDDGNVTFDIDKDFGLLWAVDANAISQFENTFKWWDQTLPSLCGWLCTSRSVCLTLWLLTIRLQWESLQRYQEGQATESTTERFRNIALLHSSYHFITNTVPGSKDNCDMMLKEL